MSGNHYACPDCGSWEGYMHRLNCAARDTLVVRPKADREAIATETTWRETARLLGEFATEWSKPYKNSKPRAVFKRFSLYPMKRKPLSPRRAREFRGRERAWLKKQVRHLSGAALEAAIS